MQIRDIKNQNYVELASELLYQQMNKARMYLIKDYRKSIMEIFKMDVLDASSPTCACPPNLP